MAAEHLQDDPIAPSQRLEIKIPADPGVFVLSCPAKDPSDMLIDVDERMGRL